MKGDVGCVAMPLDALGIVPNCDDWEKPEWRVLGNESGRVWRIWCSFSAMNCRMQNTKKAKGSESKSESESDEVARRLAPWRCDRGAWSRGGSQTHKCEERVVVLKECCMRNVIWCLIWLLCWRIGAFYYFLERLLLLLRFFCFNLFHWWLCLYQILA